MEKDSITYNDEPIETEEVRDYIPDETGYDPRDTNKDGKVGPIERRAAKGSKFAKFINKALDTQDDNAARVNLGQGFGGTVETNSHLAKDDKPAQAAIEVEKAKEAAGTNKQLQERASKLEEAKKPELESFTQETASETERKEAGDVGDNIIGDGEGVSQEVTQTAKKDPSTRYKMKSILDAYYDGDIDSNTRDYMILDTFSNFARNMGKDVGNVAAAYSGGTVDNERGTSMWDKRNQAMAQSAIEGEQSGVEGSREKRMADQQAANLTATTLNNLNIADRRKLAAQVEAEASGLSGPLKYAALDLANKLRSGGSMSMYDIAGTGLVDLIKEFIPGL